MMKATQLKSHRLPTTLFATLAVAATMLSVLVSSCTPSTPTVGTTSARPPEAPAARGEMPELSQGSCGGFTDLPLAPTVSMLGDRVRVPALEGAEDPHADRRLQNLLSEESMEWLQLRLEDAELAVRVSETYQRPGSDLFAAVRAKAEGATVATRPTPGGELVIRFPKPPAEDKACEDPEECQEREERARAEARPDHNVPLFDAFIRTKHSMVVEVAFFARKKAADQGGCERVALRMAEAATSGTRALSTRAGAHQLFADLAIDVPAEHVITVKDGGHFGMTVMVYPIVDIATSRPFMMFWFDRHAGRKDIGKTPSTTVTAPAYGAPAEWRQWTSKEGMRWRDVMLDKGPTSKVLIAIGAKDEATLEALGTIAGSLTHKVVTTPLAACSSFPKPGAATKPREDEHLRTLLEARQVALDSEVWGARRPGELDAFLAIAKRPHDDRAAAFRHLAEHGTAAGRIYGLAGLYLADPAGFSPVLCAVRGQLTGSVSVGLQCGPRPKQATDLVESSDASTVDLRGGALARRIWAAAIHGGQSELAPDGYVPVVTPAAAPPAPLTPGTAPSPKIAYRDASLCFTREDGRVACVGEVWALPKKLKTGKERVFLLPDMVRFPADIAIADDGVCLLDVKGRRACVGGLERALESRDLHCDIPVPNTPVYRVFEDGPWSRLLTIGDQACGIRQSDGALYCFLDGPRRASPTKWVEEGQGLYRPYGVPLEGRVVGTGTAMSSSQERSLSFYAFTEDGGLWEWDAHTRATLAHKFEVAVEHIAHVGGADFVTLKGGKVLARGLASDKDPFARGDRSHTKWIEIGALHGSRVHASIDSSEQLGCSIDTNGKVGCWGDCPNGVLGRDCCKAGEYGRQECKRADAVEAVPALQRSTELHLSRYLTCGRKSPTSLSCMGKGLEWMVGKDGTRGAITLDLRALGRKAPELPAPDPLPTSPELLQRIRSSSSLDR